VGGVDVQVRETDFDNALLILKELQNIENSSKEVPGDLKNGYEKVLVYCPECESTNVYRKKGSFFSFGAKEHICVDCQAKWKQ
jgi:transposase-like protein